MYSEYIEKHTSEVQLQTMTYYEYMHDILLYQEAMYVFGVHLFRQMQDATCDMQ